MSTFDAHWLALREPFDAAARASALARLPLVPWAARARRGVADGAIGVLDLGAGTGANLRTLAPLLGGPQRWWLVDHDARLLAQLPAALSTWAARAGIGLQHTPGSRMLVLRGPDWHAEVRWQCQDLAAPPGRLPALPWAQAQLLTASALLDLASRDWLDALLRHAEAARAACLFALSVDGRVDWTPPLAQDARLHALFAAHQRRDKGLGGPALGESAPAHAAAALKARGYAVALAASDWCIGPGDAAMLQAMTEGLAQAAREQGGAEDTAWIDTWRRQRAARAHETQLRVGHQDLLAWPAPAA